MIRLIFTVSLSAFFLIASDATAEDSVGKGSAERSQVEIPSPPAGYSPSLNEHDRLAYEKEQRKLMERMMIPESAQTPHSWARTRELLLTEEEKAEERTRGTFGNLSTPEELKNESGLQHLE